MGGQRRGGQCVGGRVQRVLERVGVGVQRVADVDGRGGDGDGLRVRRVALVRGARVRVERAGRVRRLGRVGLGVELGADDDADRHVHDDGHGGRDDDGDGVGGCGARGQRHADDEHDAWRADCDVWG